MPKKIALAIYLIIGLIDLVMGVIYVSSNEFMSYHSQAVGTSWQEVDAKTQTLILALMKVAGGRLVSPRISDRDFSRWLIQD